MKRIATVLVLAAALFSLAACGTASVSKSDVQSQVKKLMATKIKVPFTVKCDGDLTAKKGKSERCIVSDDSGEKLGVTVSVTGVSGGKAQMHIQADNSLMSQ